MRLSPRAREKLPLGTRPICYCLGETEEEGIRAKVEATGQSRATERIRAHIAAGRCACDVRNPRGRCCLGDVIATTERVQAENDEGKSFRQREVGRVLRHGPAIGDVSARERYHVGALVVG